MSLKQDSSCEAESSVGPDEAIWNVLNETDDASPLCCSEGDPTLVAASLFWNLTEVQVPPETKILYEDWMPHYRADGAHKLLLDRGPKNQVSMDEYLCTKGPQWSYPHICRDGKICVPKSIVFPVIRAVHACAHPGQAKTVELFLRRFDTDMPYARLWETVNKALSDCVVCAQAKTRHGRHPDSCKPFPVPSVPFSSVAITFVDLPEVPNQSTKTEIFANYAMVIVCRLTGYVIAIPCCKGRLTSRKAAELFLHRCGFFMGLPREIQADNQSIITSTFFNTKEGPYQDRLLLYPFHRFLSLLWSCFSPGSASSCPILHNFPQQIVKYGSFTQILIPCNNQLPSTIAQILIIHTEGFQGCLRSRVDIQQLL